MSYFQARHCKRLRAGCPAIHHHARPEAAEPFQSRSVALIYDFKRCKGDGGRRIANRDQLPSWFNDEANGRKSAYAAILTIRAKLTA